MRPRPRWCAWPSRGRRCARAGRRPPGASSSTSPGARPIIPHALDALVLAAELAIGGRRSRRRPRELLDRIVQTYPTHPRTDFARLNRGILLVRAGDAAGGPDRAARLARAARRSPRCSAARTPRSAPRCWRTATRPARSASSRWPSATGSGRSRASASAPSRCAGAAGTTPRKSVHRGARRRHARRRDRGRRVRSGRRSRSPRTGGATSSSPAQAALAALPPGPRERRPGRRAALRRSPAIAVDEKDWPGALGYRAGGSSTTTRRTRPPTTRSSASAAGAAGAAAWPVALEADTLLRQRYPQSPFTEAAARAGGRGAARDRPRGRGPARDRPGRWRRARTTPRAHAAAGPRARGGRRPSRRARGLRARRARWHRRRSASTPALFGHAAC